MDELRYKDLKKNEEYRCFRKQQQFRSLGGAMCIALFWIMLCFANNPSEKS